MKEEIYCVNCGLSLARGTGPLENHDMAELVLANVLPHLRQLHTLVMDHSED